MLNSYGAQIAVGVLGSLIAAIIMLALPRLFDRVRQSRGYGLVLRVFLWVTLLGSSLVQVYYIWSLTLLDTIPAFVLEGVVLALLTQIISSLALYSVDRAQKRQFYGKIPITIPVTGEVITVRLFKQAWNLPDADRLQLTWETYGEGLAILEGQINAALHNYGPDLCVGVNPSGMLAAAYLSAKLWDARIPVGYVCIRKDDQGHPYFLHKSLPPAGAHVNYALIVDSEIKSGENLEHLAAELRTLYGSGIQLRYAALWACRVEKDIKTMTDLRSRGLYRASSDDYLPRYLAFIAPSRVWKPGKIH